MTSANNPIRVVLSGGYLPATAGNPRPHGMPPFAQVLGDADIAAVLSYVRTSWGNAAAAVEPHNVTLLRQGRVN
jgi:mono/diheme cytochrome c family protein